MGLITAITIICLQLNTRGPCQLRANWIAGVGRPVRVLQGEDVAACCQYDWGF